MGVDGSVSRADSLQRWRLATAVLAVVAVVASAITVVALRREPTRTDSASRLIDAGAGVVVYASADSIGDDADIVASTIDGMAGNEFISPATSTFQLEVRDGELQGPVVIELPLLDGVDPEGAELYIAHLDDSGELVDIQAALLNPTGSALLTTAASFSRFFGFSINSGWLQEQGTALLSALTGGAYQSVRDPTLGTEQLGGFC